MRYSPRNKRSRCDSDGHEGAITISASMKFYASLSGGMSWESAFVSIHEAVVGIVVKSILGFIDKTDTMEVR